MQENKRIFRFASWCVFMVWLLSVAFILAVFICGCSSSRKYSGRSEVTVAYDSAFVEASESCREEMTEQSESSLSMVADSVKVYPLRVAAEADDPPDMRHPVYPAYAASLYGLKLNLSNAGSSSLLGSMAATKSSAESAASFDSSSEEEESASAESESSSCIWGIVVFMGIILAAVLAVRYLVK